MSNAHNKTVADSAGQEWRPVSLPKELVDDGIKTASQEMALEAQVAGERIDGEMAQRANMARSASNYGALNGQFLAADAPNLAATISHKQKQLMIVMAVFLALTLLGLGLVIGRHLANTAPLYVAWPTASVYEDATYEKPIYVLQRGESVAKLETLENFYKIRDLDGKIGFIEKSKLADKKPPYLTGSAFYGCKQYLTEDSSKFCLVRAEEQFQECNNNCVEDISGSCKAKCQNLVVTCKAQCVGH